MEDIKEKNNNQIASRSKIFMAAILDFCIQMILLTLVFGLGGLNILKNSNVYYSYSDNVNGFKSYLIETRLYTEDKNGDIISSDEEALNYVKKLVKTTYFFENLEFTNLNSYSEEAVETINEEDTINYISNGEYVNDNLAYYFLYYRESSLSDLRDAVKSNYGENNSYKNKFNYLFNYGLKANSLNYKSYFNLDIFDDNDGFISKYPESMSIINKQTATTIHDYVFLGKDSESAEKIVTDLTDLYTNALNVAFEELNNSSSIYKTFDNKVKNSQNTVYKAQVLALFISYVISFGIYYVLIPVFYKNEKTFGLRFSRLMMTLSNDDELKFKNILVRDILLFFTQAISMIIPLVFLGSNLFSVIYVDLGLGIRFVYILIPLFLLSLSSLIFMSANKKHQFLPNYAALIVVKDIDTLKISEDHEVIE